MFSPAWAHRERVLKAQAAKAAKASLEAADEKAIQQMAAGNDKFKLLLAAIAVDCNRISDLPKGSARTERKRELLKTYLPLVKKYIEGDDEYTNTVMTQVLIWLFDVGDIATALDIAAVAIAQGQPLPERFKRNVKTYVADAFLEWARIQHASGDSVEPYFTAMLADVLEWSIHDDIKLKYIRLAAELAQEAGDLDKALELCEQAEKLSPSQAKVKTRKSDILKAIALRDEKANAEQAKA